MASMVYYPATRGPRTIQARGGREGPERTPHYMEAARGATGTYLTLRPSDGRRGYLLRDRASLHGPQAPTRQGVRLPGRFVTTGLVDTYRDLTLRKLLDPRHHISVGLSENNDLIIKPVVL